MGHYYIYEELVIYLKLKSTWAFVFIYLVTLSYGLCFHMVVHQLREIVKNPSGGHHMVWE